MSSRHDPESFRRSLLGELEGRPHEQFLWGETGNGLCLTQIARQSLARQETFRFVKQSYNLEDIQVMKYQWLKNLVVLVTVAAYFAAAYLGQQMKLRILIEKLLIISQRSFGIPPSRFYALADGTLAGRIRLLLSGSPFRSAQESP